MIYEGLGLMISVISDQLTQQQTLQQLMHYCQNDLVSIVNEAKRDLQSLALHHNIKMVDFIIKANTKVADSVGPVYYTYLQLIFNEIMQIYKVYSDCILHSVRNQAAYQDHIIKNMKAVRRDALSLI